MRIREPSESWLGADTTPPHQGLNLLRDQTHLCWAGIIISSIGQFLYYSHPSTCEIWTLVRHLLVHISHFRDNLVIFIAAIKFGGWKKNFRKPKYVINVYKFINLSTTTRLS